MKDSEIDGKWGSNTEKYILIRTVTVESRSGDIKKLQKALGMKDSEIDGKWSLKLEEYLSKY